MEEEADDGVREELADELGHDEQVVVVHPNEVARAVDVDDGLGVCFIGGEVVGPVGVCGGVFSGDVLPEEIVEERPEGCRLC